MFVSVVPVVYNHNKNYVEKTLQDQTSIANNFFTLLLLQYKINFIFYNLETFFFRKK